MQPIDQSLSDADLQQRRVAIRRDLVRGNTTAILLLIALVALALLAALQASRADAARREATAKLWDSYRAQARAARLSGEGGRRTEAIAALQAAAKIRPSRELADEAIAALALTDLGPTTNYIDLKGEPFGVGFNADLTMYFYRTAQKVEIRSFANNETLLSWPASSLPDAGKFSYDGKLAAIGYRNGALEIHDLTTTNETWSVRLKPGLASHFDISRDGKRVAYRAENNKVTVFDLQTKTAVFSLEAPWEMWRPGFSPDGKSLAVSGQNRLSVWSLENDQPKLLREFSTPHNLNSMAWHHDSTEVAAGSEDHLVYVWDVVSGRQTTLDGHTREVVSVSYSPTSDMVVSYAWDGTSRFWNSRTGDELFKSHQGWGATFRCDGKALAFLKPSAGIGIWEIAQSDQLSIIGHPTRSGGWVRWGDFTPDGKLFAIAFYYQVQIWDVAARKLLAEIPGRDIKSAVFTGDGRSIIGSDTKGIREWQLEWKHDCLEAKEVQPAIFDKQVEKMVVLDVDRRTLAFSGGHDGGAGIVDLATREIHHVGNQPGGGNVSLSPDGKFLGIGTWKAAGTRIWDVTEKKIVKELDRRDAFVAFAPQGSIFVTGYVDEYCFWDTRTWSNLLSLNRDVPVHATGPVAFSRDGKLAALSLTGWSLDLVDVAQRKIVTSLTCPVKNPVSAITFSDDGAQLAATTTDGYVQIWDLPRLRQGLGGFGLKFMEGEERKASIGSAQPFSSTTLTAIILAAVVSALFVGVNGLQRHRRLVDEYSSIEKLVMQRNAQLESYRTELAHSQKMRALGTLAAGIAHDFNNLLSVIRMANKLTAKEGRANADIAENAKIVEEAVEQGKQVVKSMLGYSRASDIDEGPYAVAELVENVVPLLSRQFLAGITLTLELDYTAPPVTRARTRLQQVLLNLIVNASEAMAGQGKLVIAVKAETALPETFVRKPLASAVYVRLSVADSGPGIEPKVLPRIFEPFFTTKNIGSDPGTGLGLSLVYTVAQEEGLGLAVETARGAGATFHIYIPVNGAGELTAPAAAEHPDTPTNPTGRA